MGRSLLACLSAASLVFAALAAPMTHVHDDAPAGTHHRGAVVHTHTAIHVHAATPGHHETEVGEAGHDEGVVRALNLFQMVGGWTQPVVGLAPAIAALPLPVIRIVTVRRLAQHGHDPPFARTGPSRAPPSPLS